MNNSKSTLYIHLLMFISVVLAASSFPIGAAITNELEPSLLMGIRFLCAAFLFSFYVFKKHGFRFPSKNRIVAYITLAIPLTVFFWCMFESLRYTTAINTGALYTIVPALTALYAFFINKEVVNKQRITGLFFGTIGALWIVFKGDLNAFITLQINYGDFIFFIGCIFMGIYNPLIKRLYKNEPMEVLTFWVLVFGGISLLFISGKETFTTEWSAIELHVYLSILYLSVFTTLVTFFIVQFSVLKIGPTKVAAYSFLNPVCVVAMHMIYQNELIEVMLIPGLCAVILAMFLIQRSSTVSRSLNTY